MRKGAFFAASALVAVACSSGTTAVSSRDPICTPGAYVFCLCADGSHGTKLCNDDGMSFAPCDQCEGDSFGQGGGDSTPDGPGGRDGGAGGPVGIGGAPLGGSGGMPQTGGASGSTSSGGTPSSGGTAGSGVGGAAGSQAGGSSGGSAPGNDGCPGQGLAVIPGTDTLAAGTTVGASDDVALPCAKASGPDVFYAITPSVSGTLTVKVQGQSLDAAIALWSDACGSPTPAFCADDGGTGAQEIAQIPVTAGTPVYLAVDSDGAAGAFAVTATLVPKVDGDACPGIAVSIDPGMDVSVDGDTTFAKPDEAGSATCGTSAVANDVVYAVMPSADGVLTATLTPASASYDAELYARTGSCDAGTQVACAAGAGAGQPESVSFMVTASSTVTMIVDGKGASFGPYSLALHLEAAVCGDGVVEPPEPCDPQATPNDGCTSTCTVDPAPANADCPGEVVHVWGPAQTVTGTTTGYPNYDQGSCGGTTAPDRFYELIPEVSGTMHVAITSSWHALLYARATDCISGTELACNHEPSGAATLDFPVTAGTPAWVAVDGYSGSKGDYSLAFSIQ